MRRFLAFCILASVKILSKIFFRGHYHWLKESPQSPWTKEIRLLVFLNHTSLYEPIFCQTLPFSFLWHVAGHANIPGADITLNRPIVGTFWKLMIPNIASISRKKDATWESYLSSIKHDDVVMLTPEGRMKRPNGLDKFGKPMTVRGGVADIIEVMNDGVMVLCFSGGLHHIQKPGQTLPKLWKPIHMNLERINIREYKAQFPGSARERKINIVKDLQERLTKNCPPSL